ncbi:MAG: hypothetical protein GY757_47845, partial [bacterium]|nr:hypothetical protein [bacterium]
MKIHLFSPRVQIKKVKINMAVKIMDKFRRYREAMVEYPTEVEIEDAIKEWNKEGCWALAREVEEYKSYLQGKEVNIRKERKEEEGGVQVQRERHWIIWEKGEGYEDR